MGIQHLLLQHQIGNHVDVVHVYAGSAGGTIVALQTPYKYHQGSLRSGNTKYEAYSGCQGKQENQVIKMVNLVEEGRVKQHGQQIEVARSLLHHVWQQVKPGSDIDIVVE